MEIGRVAPVISGNNTAGTSSRPQPESRAAVAVAQETEPPAERERTSKAAKDSATASAVREHREEDARTERETLERVADLLNEAAALFRRKLHFGVYEESEPFRTFVEVRDLENDEVIRKIPPEEFLDAVARIDQMIGVLIDKRA